jgi:hypothetical protein
MGLLAFYHRVAARVCTGGRTSVKLAACPIEVVDYVVLSFLLGFFPMLISCTRNTLWTTSQRTGVVNVHYVIWRLIEYLH